MTLITIIGGSVAGFQTAIHLKRHGLEVSLIEEHPEIGKPHKCAGLISSSGAKELDLDLDDLIVNKIKGARIHSPFGTELQIKKEDVALVIDREKLDKKLFQKAKMLGCDIKLGTSLINKRNETVFVRNEGRGEIIKSKYLIGADGAKSKVRELMKLHLPEQNKLVHGFQAKISGSFDKEFVDVYFGDFAKGFFGWIIPESSRKARVGLACELGCNPQKKFEEFLHKINLEGKISDELSALIPIGPPLKNISNQEMLLVGDSAFQTKASTGGGIILASNSAKILADSLNDFLTKKTESVEYEKNLMQINKELNLHWKARKFLNSFSDEALEKTFQKLKKSGFEKIISEHGNMDYPSKFMHKITKNPKLLLLVPELLKFAIS